MFFDRLANGLARVVRAMARAVAFVGMGWAVLGGAADALAQPFNVRAWYAQGQVFVVWQMTAPPANAWDTVEIYASAAAQVNTAAMQRVGRVFFPEYTGARLRELQPAARLQVPTPAGGMYRLAADEGVFAYTPRAAGNLFFAVVDTGAAAVVANNSAATAFNYDPVNEPVLPIGQFRGFTPGGNPYTGYVVFADGRDDYDNSRPDVPVLADADKNGVPHVFTITEPVGGVPAGSLKMGIALHGGGGEYELFRPGVAQRAAMQLGLTDGIILTPDDSIYSRNDVALERSNTSWFGYTPAYSPFDAGVRTEPPTGSVVVNFTSRRVFWVMDWLLGARSPYTIDASRVAIVGHSGGGRGTSVIYRQRPERFCAAVCYTPASFLDLDGAGQINYLRGNWDTNLSTNLIGPSATNLGVTDVFTMTTRLSPTQRDFPLTRVVYGKRDEEGAAAWKPEQIAIMEMFNDLGKGVMVFWDEREHGVEKWSSEESDLTDDPTHSDPWPDIGQWVAPVRTRRHSVQYLVDTYRAGQTYPGLFNVDADTVLAGRQPDCGPGDPNLGEAYGTWGGYMDWETGTLVDTATEWAATVYAIGLSAVSIDNSPFASFTTDLSPQRTANFNPPMGKLVRWSVRDAATQVQLQTGNSVTGAEGVVTVTGVVVPREPSRVRVQIGVCAADFNNSGSVSVQDIFDFLTAWFASNPSADINRNGNVGVQDIFDFLARWFAGC